jgi:hypothetical protein
MLFGTRRSTFQPVLLPSPPRPSPPAGVGGNNDGEAGAGGGPNLEEEVVDLP